MAIYSSDLGMIGSYIGQYELIEIIGSGGMSTVYKAYQPSHDRYVALKLMPRQLSEDPTFLKRFQREAQVIAHLAHPSVIPIYEYGEHEGQPYIVMRLIEGGTLRKKLFYEYLDLPVIAHIIEQVASALDYAHSQGVIHRDLKPSNILLDEDNNAYLTDFGIAKMLGSTSQVTGSGVVGTPSYMSPEQCQAKELTGQSDVYALGAILFEMLTGRPPYEADVPLSVMYKHVKDPIPTVTDILPDMPPEIDQITRRALAKKTKDRYRDARSLAADFRRYVEGQPIVYDRPPESIVPPPSDFPYDPRVQAAQPTIARYEPVRRGVMPLVGGIIGLAVILALVGGGLAVLASVNNQGSLIPTIPPTATKSSPTAVIGEITPTALESMTGVTLTPTNLTPTTGSASNTPRPPTITPIVPPSATPTATVPTNTPTPTNTSAPTATPTITFTPTPTATLTLTPTNTPLPTGGTGLIAFNIGNNQSSEIAVVDANGQNFKALTVNGAYDGEADWSSNGGKIAFESERDGNMEIYTMSSAGTGVQRLTNTPNIEERHPDWSPDGSVITFESRSGAEDTLEIFVMNADGSNKLQLTGNGYGDRAPQFSPDGTQIAYMTHQRGKWEIAIMAYPGGQQVSIFDCPSLNCRFPAWSPDGSKIAFNTLDSSGNADQIWILTVATGQSALLLDGPECGRPVWSGDGVFIFYNRTVSGNLDLYRVKVSTKEVERLTSDAKDEFAPDWGP